MLVPRARSNLSHRANGEGAGPRRPHALILQTRGVARRRRSALTRICRPIHLSNSPARSRGAFFAPGVLPFASRTRNEGWAERRKNVGCLRGTRSACSDTPGACEAPCVPCARDARLSALHRGDFGLRSRASLTGLASGSVTASSSHPGPSARRAGPGASRGERLPAARRGTPLLAPSSRRCSRRHPSGARMDVDVASARYAVKRKLCEMCCCSRNVRKDYWRQ